MGQGSSIAVNCGVGCKQGSDLAWLWLCCSPAAEAPFRPLAWELPYAMGVALKKKKSKSFMCFWWGRYSRSEFFFKMIGPTEGGRMAEE